MMYDIEISPVVLKMVQPGSKVRHWFGQKTPTPRSEVWHIRAIVDDEEVVCRKWNARRGWVYFLENMVAFQLAYTGGALEAAQ